MEPEEGTVEPEEGTLTVVEMTAARTQNRMRLVALIVRKLLREDAEDRRAVLTAVESVLFPEDVA